MFQTFRNAWKIQDLRKKILFTFLIIILYRLGANIYVPWVNSKAMSEYLLGNSASFLSYINILSGNAFGNATLFALSVSPYITASIVVQLLTVAIPALERLSKEGEEGQKKIKMITRIVTAVLALVTAFGYALLLKNNGMLTFVKNGAKLDGMGYLRMATIIMCFCGGAALIMWMGEKIDEFGIGNGISTILFANIIARLPYTMKNLYVLCLCKGEKNANGVLVHDIGNGYKELVPLLIGIGIMLVVLVALIALVYFCVWFTNSERRIPIQYAKRVVGRKMYGGQNSSLPLKMNMSGVMPIIFASSIVSIPSTIAGFIGQSASDKVEAAFGTTSWAYILVYVVLIIAFSYFYVLISFNPVEVANNIKNNGGAVPGIRPGRPTVDYIKKILNRVTFIGALFLIVVAGLPLVANAIYSAIAGGSLNDIAFGGSSLLIIVGVALETAHELEAQMAMRNYKGFLD